jgi:hypothetical protein
MRAEQQPKGSLKGIGDLQAALDEHASVANIDPCGILPCAAEQSARYEAEKPVAPDKR